MFLSHYCMLLLVVFNFSLITTVVAFHHEYHRKHVRTNFIFPTSTTTTTYTTSISPRRVVDIPVVLFSKNEDNEDEDEDEDELIRLIRGPLGAKRPRIRSKAVIILSDGTGTTAKALFEKTISLQFNECDERFFSSSMNLVPTGGGGSAVDDDDDDDEVCEVTPTKLYPFIQSLEEVEDILQLANEKYKALIIFTFADPKIRTKTSEICKLSNIPYVDLLGPMFDTMSIFFNRDPLGCINNEPSKQTDNRRSLSDVYYRRIDAVEFTLKCDDGMSPNLLQEADVILLGVSRTGKTPLSVVLSQSMGLKVSNIPLVVGLSPPKQLFESGIDPNRVFCLMLNETELLRIQKNRLQKELGSSSSRNDDDDDDDDKGNNNNSQSTYTDIDYLQKDLDNAKTIANENNYTIIDVTGRAVEETASYISSMLNERFDGSIFIEEQD